VFEVAVEPPLAVGGLLAGEPLQAARHGRLRLLRAAGPLENFLADGTAPPLETVLVRLKLRRQRLGPEAAGAYKNCQRQAGVGTHDRLGKRRLRVSWTASHKLTRRAAFGKRQNRPAS